MGELVSWIAGRASPDGARIVATGTLAVGLVASLALWVARAGKAGVDGWLVEAVWPWIPAWGIQLHLAVDGLSLVLVGLTFFLGLMAVGISWQEIDDQIGFFHFNVLWLLSGVVGVFLALDLVLFYFFWELMLVPMYYVIGIWGHERRVYAALKFFIFTQASGLLMLLAILGLATAKVQATGTLTFDYPALLGTDLSSPWSMLFFLGLEILSVSLYGLIAYLRHRRRDIEAGLKYLILAAAASAFLIFGIALLYAESGSLAFDGITATGAGESLFSLVTVGLTLVVVGVGFKLALVPFHVWTPDVYQGAPAPVTAFIATVSKGGVLAVLLRLLEYVTDPGGAIPAVLAGIAIVSMIVGNLLALMQENLERLLAYSSIAHL